MTIKDLKEKILGKFNSVHAFCKAHPELPRATVYLLLSGKYPAKSQKQIARIWKTLNTESIEAVNQQPEITPITFCEELQSVKCANCRRLNRRECLSCRDQTSREGLELYSRLYAWEIEKPREQI